jgi:hypothetical protein
VTATARRVTALVSSCMTVMQPCYDSCQGIDQLTVKVPHPLLAATHGLNHPEHHCMRKTFDGNDCVVHAVSHTVWPGLLDESGVPCIAGKQMHRSSLVTCLTYCSQHHVVLMIIFLLSPIAQGPWLCLREGAAALVCTYTPSHFSPT